MDARTTVILAICAVVTVLGEPPKAPTLTLSQSQLAPGGELSVTCQTDATSLCCGNFIQFWKQLPNEQDETKPHRLLIATNHIIDSKFPAEHKSRYSVEFGEEGEKKMLTLTIKDIKPEDGGELGCEIIPKEASEKVGTFKNFDVLVAPTNLEFSINGTKDLAEYRFTENSPVVLRCIVNGSNPSPNVKVTVGDTDITKQFTSETRKQMKGDINTKMVQIVKDTVLEMKNYMPDFKDLGKNVTCSAGIGDTYNLKSSFKVLMSTKPRFIDCDETQYAALHGEKKKIECRIISDPVVKEIVWSYTVGDTVKTLTVTMNKDDSDGASYSALKLRKGPSEYETIAELEIKRVFHQHYRNYGVNATNELGEMVTSIQLAELKTGYSTDGASQTSLCSALFLVLPACLWRILS